MATQLHVSAEEVSKPLEGRSVPSSEAEIERAAGGLEHGGVHSLVRVGRYPRARRRSLHGFEKASVGPYRA